MCAFIARKDSSTCAKTCAQSGSLFDMAARLSNPETIAEAMISLTYSGPRMAIGLQYFFETCQSGPILRDLALERSARRALDVTQGFFVLGNHFLGVLTAPLDDAGVALAHHHAQVHRGPIDESADAARFFAGLLAFTAETFALEIQFVGIASASGFLLLEKLNQLLLAYVGRGSAIT